MSGKFRYQPNLERRERRVREAFRGKTLESLEKADELKYERRRIPDAEALGLNPSELDREVYRRRERAGGEGEDTSWGLHEPWPDPVKGDRLLDELCTVIRRHLFLEEKYVTAVVLWVIFAHTHDAWRHSPILMLTSPVKGCGKTTLLDLLSRLVPKPYTSSNATAASIFRTISDHPGTTLLLDEGETFIHGRNEIRGILDSGHKRTGARTTRANRAYSTWAPKAIGLIGGLDPTLEDRSIRIELQKKPVTQETRLLSHRANIYLDLHRRCCRWATDNIDQLCDLDPTFPDELGDRARDNWRPLLAIAEQCGGDWPFRARKSCQQISKLHQDEDLPILLLQDLRSLFDRAGGRTCPAVISPPGLRPWNIALGPSTNAATPSPPAKWRAHSGCSESSRARSPCVVGVPTATRPLGSKGSSNSISQMWVEGLPGHVPQHDDQLARYRLKRKRQ